MGSGLVGLVTSSFAATSLRHREVAEGQREHDRIDSEQASRGREANCEASKRLQDDVPEGGENDWE
jgi:hypothetical protein